ncbi:hypothetical protein K1T71_001339 [Dendrolimus kikuchii]|uniref:Uncharacterized protein n=1 Tax=Dendrolimus kikuchii TaxID=765133 RepID=A0ACC1DHC1_9NEOP|nr:hypothetical protein K1T71_001339 [Dendrolimus kikuchii]
MASRPVPTGKKVVPTNTTKTTNAPVSDPTLEGNDEQLRHSAVIRNAIQKTSAATEQPTEQSTQNCESNNMALDVLPMVANQLYLEAKEQLEQTGYIKGVVKEKVISNLSQMYKIVLRLNDSRLKLMDKLTASEEQDITKLELVKQIGIENDLKASKILEHLKMQSDNIQETKLQMESIKEEVIKLSDDIMRHTPVENMTYAQKVALPKIGQPIHTVVISSVSVITAEESNKLDFQSYHYLNELQIEIDSEGMNKNVRESNRVKSFDPKIPNSNQHAKMILVGPITLVKNET